MMYYCNINPACPNQGEENGETFSYAIKLQIFAYSQCYIDRLLKGLFVNMQFMIKIFKRSLVYLVYISTIKKDLIMFTFISHFAMSLII